jgi:hypothetical protein
MCVTDAEDCSVRTENEVMIPRYKVTVAAAVRGLTCSLGRRKLASLVNSTSWKAGVPHYDGSLIGLG